MPGDYITLKALTSELNDCLSSGKIDKIYMPEKDEVALSIRARGLNNVLVISCNASNPRMHLSSIKKLNPINAPSFCMHLRKHLTGGIITKIELLGQDRIVCIKILSHNEMRDEIEFSLIAEMMGRYSNILVVGANNLITDTLKQVSYDTVTKRCLLAGAPYVIPSQTKLKPDDTQAIRQVFEDFDGGGVGNFICSKVAGFALSTACQLTALAGVDNQAETLSEADIDSLLTALQTMLNIYGTPNYQPCCSVSSPSKKPLNIAEISLDDEDCSYSFDDYFAMPYKAVTNNFCCDSLNRAIELCTAKKDETQRRDERAKYLQKAYNSFLSKTNKKLDKCNERLLESENMNEFKRKGDLVTANLHALKKGDENVLVTDYYDEKMPQVALKLNVQLSPQQNAQSFYKKYAKLKRTEVIVSQQISELNDLVEYVKTIQQAISMCSSPLEIAEVQQELESIGALRASKVKKKPQKNAQPLTFECDDFVICVGKNNLQNDKLTFKLAGGSDIWAHTKNIHSSHTIIFAEGRIVPDKVIETACEICAYYSEGSKNTKVECDYTLRKNLRRHPNGNPGMVLYSIYKTVYVEPKAHNELIVK